MRFPTICYVRPAKPQINLKYTLSVILLNENNLEFLSLKGDCTGCTLVKIPHCWKSHVAAHMLLSVQCNAVVHVAFHAIL